MGAAVDKSMMITAARSQQVLSRAQRAKAIEHGFANIDADGSGTIDVQELQSFLQSIGVNKTADELNLLMEEIDSDNSGVIELEEFLHNVCGIVTHTERQEALQQGFLQLDIDGGGGLDIQV